MVGEHVVDDDVVLDGLAVVVGGSSPPPPGGPAGTKCARTAASVATFEKILTTVAWMRVYRITWAIRFKKEGCSHIPVATETTAPSTITAAPPRVVA